jgi:hypothetical protein
MTLISELLNKSCREIPEADQGEPLLISRAGRRYTGFIRTIVLNINNLYKEGRDRWLTEPRQETYQEPPMIT